MKVTVGAALVFGLVACLAAAFTVNAAVQASDGTMYGISSNVGFVTIDPSTGKVDPVAAPFPHEAQAQNLASLDALRGIYYIIGYNLTNQV